MVNKVALLRIKAGSAEADAMKQRGQVKFEQQEELEALQAGSLQTSRVSVALQLYAWGQAILLSWLLAPPTACV
jgi:hypothetical protein